MKKIIASILLGLATSNTFCMELKESNYFKDPINAKAGPKDNHFTPLQMAIFSGSNNTEIIQLLINERADLNALDNKGRSCVELALAKGRIGIVQLLVDSNAKLSKDVLEKKEISTGKTALHNAAKIPGAEKFIELFCTMGADLSAKTDKGRLPLHEAVDGGYIGNVKAILTATHKEVAMRKEQEKKTASIEGPFS